MDFLNSALLGGLAAISIPVIIHLLNRRRFKVLYWAAMDFLLEAARMNRKRVQMEHLIVLLLRCLAIALVVLAVCRPVATRGALAKLPGARDQVERVVVVDDSASTGEKEGDKTAFDEEKRLVSELITDLSRERPGDLLTLIRSSRARQPDLVRSEAKSGRTDDVARRIETWQPSDGCFELDRCVDAALSSEHEGEKADKTALKRYIYFLTDFRKTDWQLAPDALQKLHERMKSAGTDTSFIIVDAGHEDTTNTGIVDVRPQEKIVTTGMGQKLIARVKNYGKSPVHDVRLELTVGGSSLPVTPVPEIKPGETKDAEISYTFADAGPFAVSVRLEGDRLPADDRRDVALEVVKSVRVLLVDGRPTDDAFESQTFFLERALTPPGEIKSGVEAVSIPAERLADEDLTNYQVVIVCDLDRFPGQRLPALERYVREGGGLAFFLGEDVDATSYEKELWTAKERKNKQGLPDPNGTTVEPNAPMVGGFGVLPCRLGELKPVLAAPAKLAAPSLDHPLLRIFAGDNNPFLSRVKSRRHFSLPLDPEKDRWGTRVICKWEDFDKTPAIVEKPFGEGRVVVFNTSASRAWTDWPREASFPVTAQELVHYLAPASTKGHNLQVGEPIQRDINPAKFESKAKLLVPGEKQPRELLASQRSESDALWFTYPDTYKAGIYQLELQPKASGSAPRLESYAVELDPREGELEKAEREPLVKQLEEGVKLKFFNANATDKTSLLAMTEGERRELWRTCAFLLLLVLAIEGVLSFIAAHHGSSASQEEVEAARRGRTGRSPGVPVSLPVAHEEHRPSSLPLVDKS